MTTAKQPAKRPAKFRARTVRVNDELWDAAAAKAEDRGDTISAVVRNYLRRYVKEK